MGVRECDRSGCGNIMCDRYSTQYGYICNECFEELINSGPTTDIDEFMKVPKKKNNYDESRARYSAVFTLC